MIRVRKLSELNSIFIQATRNFRVLFCYWHDWCSGLTYQRFAGDRNQIKKITRWNTNFSFMLGSWQTISYTKPFGRGQTETIRGQKVFLFNSLHFSFLTWLNPVFSIKREACIHTNISGVVSHLWIFTVVSWGTPLCKPFRYVPSERAWFLRRFGLKKRVLNLPILAL